ncbi:MAG: hypothetical protein WCO00_13915 [Rhodospirillaceae bacterium]
MGLFGAIASVASGFHLVPTGTAGGTEAVPAPAAPDSAAAAVTAPVVPVPAAPSRPLSGPLRAQASEIAAREGAALVRDRYLREVGALFAAADGAPDLGSRFEAFSQSWRGLAAAPQDAAAARAVLTCGEALGTCVRTLAAGVERLAGRVATDVGTGLDDLNQTLGAIYRENRTIATQAALNRPSDEAEARRDILISKVVETTGANVFSRENRGIALYTASGQALLDGQPTRFTSTATAPAVPGAVIAEGRINDGRLGALLRLAADGSRARPPRPADPASEAEIPRKLRSQLDAVATTLLGRSRPKQPTSFSDAYDMAPPGSGSDLGFGFFIGADRHSLEINPELLSGTKTLKSGAAAAVAASLTAGGRQIGADGLTLPGGSYGQLAGVVSGFWSWLSAGATHDADIASLANTLMDGYRQDGGHVDIPGEVSRLGSVESALTSSRRVSHALGEFLGVLDQIAA